MATLTSAPPRTDLSVLIVSWNTRALLADCLRSIYAGDPQAEIWVVDNASTDGSADMVRTDFPDVRLIQNRENVGFARANNQALAEASGRYLLLLNPDTIVPPGALTTLVATLDARPDAAGCGPLLRNADGSLQLSWARFPGPKSELTGRLDRSQLPYPLSELTDPARRAFLAPFAVDWVGGACLLLRADALHHVGLLDEGFFMYSEETDLCYRLSRALGLGAGKILLVPTIAVTHLGGQSSRAVPRETRRRLFRSAVRLYRRIYGLSPTGIAAITLAWGRYLLSPLRSQLRHNAPIGAPASGEAR